MADPWVRTLDDTFLPVLHPAGRGESGKFLREALRGGLLGAALSCLFLCCSQLKPIKVCVGSGPRPRPQPYKQYFLLEFCLFFLSPWVQLLI